jgi:hypothetical protein
MNSSAHIALETFVEIAEHRLAAGILETALAHAQACSDCNQKLRRVQQVIQLMKTDTAEDAPRDVLASAINIFSPEKTSTTAVRRVVAALTFDSRSAGPAFGMRSLYTDWRQLLYSAQESDIDLRIRVQNEECFITGQVIRDGCSEGLVEISGATGSTQTSLNSLCEFTLPAIPVGKYSLRVMLPDVEIEIPDLKLED